MKILKTLSKRGLALFLVLTMCLSLLPTTAMAAEMAEADHVHNEDGWVCVRGELICGMEEHHHDESCYATTDEPDTGDVDTNEENQETEETQTPDDSQESQEPEENQPSDDTQTPDETQTEETKTEDTQPSQGTQETEDKTETEEKNPLEAVGDFLGNLIGGIADAFTQTLSAVFEGDEPEETTCGKAEHTHTADCYEWHCTAPVTVQIPEDATEITPDKLTSAAYNRAMDMTAFFGLVQSSDVLGNNATPASITFVGEDVDVTVKYEDAASSSAEISVGEDAISYNGNPVAVYAQGEAKVADGSNTLADQGTIDLQVYESKTLAGSGGDYDQTKDHSWSSNKSTIASVTDSSSNTATVTGVAEGQQVTITHTFKSSKYGIVWSNQQDTWTVNVTAAQKYTVTFNAGDGTDTAYTTDPVSTLTAPKCSFTAPEGKQFKNWLAPDGKTYNVGDPVELSEGLTLTAVYEDEPVGESYNLYCYTRIPGSATSDNANAMWNGMGVSTVSGVDAPSSSSIGARFDIGNPAIVAYPESYPDITHPTTKAVFKYAKDGSAEANMQGYYTIQWNTYVTVSNGANAGGNNHNSTVDSGTNTYHLDGAITLNESDYFTVNFMVQLPEASAFSAYDFENYSQRVAKDTAESSLKNPGTLANQTHTGVTYHFDGWYTDETCQTKATFNGTITKNTNYYGKYVRDTANYTVKHYQENLNGQYEEVTSDTETTSDTIGKEVSATAKTYPGFTCVEIEGKTVASGKILANGSLELKLYYTRNTYTVEYNLNGGTSEAALKYENQKYGVNTPKIANPTRTGYTFAAWSPAVADTVTGNATYVAQWTENREETKNLSYTVQYFKNGVADGAPATFTKSVWVNSTDTTLEVQENSVNTSDYFGANYAFKKTEPATIPDTVNNGDVIKVYYLEKFTVTYTDGVDDKEIFANDVHDVKYGDGVPATKLTEQNLKRNDGYKFNGWSPAYDATAKVTENKTYTAQWVVDPEQTHEVSYTVEYYKDDVLQDNDTQTKKQNVQLLVNTLTVDKTKINTTNKYQGYKLNATAPATIPDTVTNGTVIKVYYVKDSFGYTVEYYFDNELDSSKTVGTGEKAEYGTSILTAAGITTIAEADVKHGTPEQNYALDRVENRNGTITDDANNNVVKIFYALDANDDDTPDKYQATVTYKVTGGYWNAASQDGVDKGPYVLTLKEKDTNGVWQNVSDMPSMQVPEASAMGAKDGYTATGADWKDVTPPATASVDMCGQTLVYEYVYPARSDLTYTVKYLECSTDGTPLDPSVKVYENATSGAYALGATVTLAEILTAHQATISGFEYHHASLSEGASLTISAPATGRNVVTLYYTRKSFEVTYAYDGTEPAGVSDAPSKQSHAYEADVTVADDPQTIPAGYTFNGWATTDVTVTNGTFQMPAKDVTFTGSFTANSYTVKFDKNAPKDATVMGAMADQKFTYDVKRELAANAYACAGYTFMGWAVASDKSTVAYADKEEVINLTAENNGIVTLYAVWEAKDALYTVKYFQQNVEGTDYVEVAKDTQGKTGKTGAEVSVPEKSYDGFQEIDTRADGQYPVSGTIAGDGSLVLARYYDRINSYTYTVKYVDEDTNEELHSDKDVPNQTFGAVVTENAIAIEGYTVTSEAQQSIAIKVTGNEIVFTYSKDVISDPEKDTDPTTPGDGIPDKYQAVVVFESADEEMGTVTGEGTYQVFTFMDGDRYVSSGEVEPSMDKVTYNGNGGYAFTHWTRSITTPEGFTTPEVELVAKETPADLISTVQGGTTITFKAYFAPEVYDVTVKYLLEDTDTELLLENVTKTTFDAKTKTAAYDVTELVSNRITADRSEYAGKTFVRVDNAPLTGTVTGDTVINVYYALDVISDPGKDTDTDPDQPGDGIADKYQVVVKYVSADDSKGTVTGATTKVFTLGDEPNYAEQGAITPGTDGVKTEANANAGYKFDGWTPDPTAEMTVKGGQEYTYTAKWTKRDDLSYVVMHLEKDTNNALHLVDIVENQTFGTVIQAADKKVAIDGYDYDSADNETLTVGTDESKNIIKLYYTRKSFEVTYKYVAGTPEGASELPQKDAVEYKKVMDVAEDATLKGYTFNGWSTNDATVAEGKFTMPAKDVTFTGSFTANSYTIAFDKNAADATGTTASLTGVKYDQEVSLTPNGFERPGYAFVGWAVESDKSTVVYADKAKVTNLTDVDDDTVTLYAVWQAKGDTPYTVKYFQENVAGTGYDEVTTDTVKANGKTDTEVTAPAMSYDGFRETSNRAEGQYPDTGIITGDGKLVVARYYDRIKTYSYTVNYLEEGTNEVLYPQKQVIDQTFGASVTENPMPVAGYTSPAAQTITIGLDENVINFYYTKRSDLSYTINYYKDSVADGNKLGETVTVNGQTFGTEVSLSDEQLKDRAPEGYVELGAGEPAKLTIKESGNNFNVVYAKRTDLSYTVNYLENDTEKVLSQAKVVNGQEFGKSITEAAIDIEGYVKPETTSQTITIGVENNVINFYYTARTDLSYTVKYVDEDTNKELESDKNVPDQTFGAVVTENAIAIEGYTVTSEAQQSITIKVTGNEIVFTYSKDVISDPSRDPDKDPDNGDGIPDKYQAVVVFESADETTGTVEGNTYQVFTFENNGSYVSSGKVDPEMVTYKGKGIYAFTHWTWSISTPLGGTAGEAEIPSDKTPVEMAKLLTVQGGTTITFKAYFAPEVYDVTVKYLLEGTNTELLSESPAQKTTFDAESKTAAYDVTELVSNRITADRSEYAGKTFVRVDNTALTGTVTADTVINVYYALDVISDPGKDTDTDPDQPGDGIADKYQVVVKYVSADDSKGTVTGDNTTKVFTLGTAPNYVERDAITPGTAGVEPKANADAGYKFDGWQMDGRDISPDDLLNVEGGHEYTYTAKWAERDDLTYTVMYLEKGTNTPLHLADIVKNQKFGTVIQAADQKIEIDGYNYDSVSADTLKIGTGSNILYIYYTKRSDLSYTVNYRERGTEKILHEQKVVNNQAFDASVTEKAIDIDGYDKVAPAEQSIKIAVSGNEITFYYTKRTDLSYTVNYLEQGTDKVLHEQKVADNQTFETVINAAAEVISIDNYQYVSASTDSIKIGIDESANVINLYYTQKTYTVRVSYKLTDDGKTFTAVQPLENGTSAAIGYPNGWTVSTADGADVVVPATIPQTKDGKTNNYVLDTALSEPMSGNAPKSGDDKAVVTVELVYSLDNMSDPSKDPDPANPGDGIPDDRQITVNFKAVNGTVNPASTVVTKMKDGVPAEDGIAVLAQAHIPSTRADTGFTGGTWDKAPAVGVEVVANETMTITYERIVNTITIEVVNGTASASSIYVLYGENSAPITFSGSEGYVLGSATVDGAPVELTNGMYTFYGVVKDHIIRVVYVQGTFTATFVDGQTGATIETRSDLTALPAESTYPAAPEHEGYDFIGWTIGAADADGNVTITANYKPAEVEDETFTVIFTDGLTGETIEERPGIVELPDEGAYPTAPEHEGYDFIGWTTPVEDADGNYTITANYVPVEIPVGTHTVTWVNWNGVQLQQIVVNDGDAEPDYTGAAPVRPSDTAYTYAFRGWSAPVVDADGNVTYTAQYTPSAIVPEGPDVPVGPTEPVTPPTPPTVIPDNPVPLAPPTTTITDQDVPLAGAIGLNDVDHFAYVIGYDDDTVRPLNNITRAEVATIFFRLMTDEYRTANWATTNDFSDVKAGSWYNNAISTCAKAGLLTGYPDGTFKPNQSITRAEFAAIAARFLSDEVTGENVGDFSDTANHWAAKEIRRAAEAGWVTGSNNEFRPNDKINRAEVMTIVNRMLDRIPDAEHMLDTMKKWTDNPEGTWYYEAVQEATNEHAYERDELGVTETWTEILEARDWKALEAEWASANAQ